MPFNKEIVKKNGNDLEKFFGFHKGKKIDSQKMKDDSRKIWDL